MRKLLLDLSIGFLGGAAVVGFFLLLAKIILPIMAFYHGQK